jgi:hypothetical protein
LYSPFFTFLLFPFWALVFAHVIDSVTSLACPGTYVCLYLFRFPLLASSLVVDICSNVN